MVKAARHDTFCQTLSVKPSPPHGLLFRSNPHYRWISVQKLDQSESKEYSNPACKVLDELLKVLLVRLVVHEAKTS
jgi:hypothetical protein